jgi:hypothetical protein
MKTVPLAVLALGLVSSVAVASPPWLLEGLLTRAKIVFIGKVTGIEKRSVTLEVVSWERGKNEKKSFTFLLADDERKPEKDERYFVFSQGNDEFGEPKDVVQTRQGLACIIHVARASRSCARAGRPCYE